MANLKSKPQYLRYAENLLWTALVIGIINTTTQLYVLGHPLLYHNIFPCFGCFFYFILRI
jgi:hypothetical protein